MDEERLKQLMEEEEKTDLQDDDTEFRHYCNNVDDEDDTLLRMVLEAQ